MDSAFADLIPASPAPAASSAGSSAFADLIPSSAPPAAPESNLDYATGLAQKTASGITSGFADEATASMGSLFGLGPKLLGTKSYDEILSDVRGKEKTFETRHPVASTAAEITGAVPAVVGGLGALRAIPWLGRAATALERVPGFIPRTAIKGAVAGAPYGALHEVGKAEDISTPGEYLQAAEKGAKEGAIGGALFTPAIEGAGQAVASTVGPWAKAEAQKLIEKGVPLTIGETIGGGAKAVEDLFGHLPLAGIMVRKAQQKSMEGFNRAALNEALAPIGETIEKETPVGHDAIREAFSKVSGSFDDVLAKTRGYVDAPLQTEIKRIRDLVPEVKRGEFDDAVKRNVLDVASPKTRELSRNAFKQAESALGQEASGLLRSQVSTPYDKMLGTHLYTVRDAIVDMAKRHNPAPVVKQLMDANEAFGRLLRIERAAGSVAADQGAFTPSQLNTAVRASDRSMRKSAFAKGEAKLQDFSENAKAVMGSKLPQSGTPERLMMGALIHGGLSSFGIPPGGLAAEAAIGGLYTSAIQSALRKAASGSPKSRQAIADLIRRATELGGAPLAVSAGSNQ